MNLENKRCGNCGEKAFKPTNLNGTGKIPWKDYPSVFLTKDLELWVCQNCNEIGVTRGDAKRIDDAVKATICDQIDQFVDVAVSKSGIPLKEICRRLGISYTHLSNIRNERRVPQYGTWAQLRAAARHPETYLEEMDPDRDVRKENILLRA